jgi:hypothetical protein
MSCGRFDSARAAYEIAAAHLHEVFWRHQLAVYQTLGVENRFAVKLLVHPYEVSLSRDEQTRAVLGEHV